MKTNPNLAADEFSPAVALPGMRFPPPIPSILYRRIVYYAACIISLFLTAGIYAQSLNISVSKAQYTTFVEAEGWPIDIYPSISRTTTSSSPISDAIERPNEKWGGLLTNHAIARAGLFEVSDQTGFGFANAAATSQLWFSPLADQTQTIGIEIYALSGGFYHSWTGGRVNLYDLTSNSEVWNYSWDYNDYNGNIPWNTGTGANFTLDTDFLRSHQYQLTMMTSSNAGDDRESVQIQLTGLVAVPEPASVCLILLGLLGLAGAGWIPTSGHWRSDSRCL